MRNVGQKATEKATYDPKNDFKENDIVVVKKGDVPVYGEIVGPSASAYSDWVVHRGSRDLVSYRIIEIGKLQSLPSAPSKAEIELEARIKQQDEEARLARIAELEASIRQGEAESAIQKLEDEIKECQKELIKIRGTQLTQMEIDAPKEPNERLGYFEKIEEKLAAERTQKKTKYSKEETIALYNLRISLAQLKIKAVEEKARAEREKKEPLSAEQTRKIGSAATQKDINDASYDTNNKFELGDTVLVTRGSDEKVYGRIRFIDEGVYEVGYSGRARFYAKEAGSINIMGRDQGLILLTELGKLPASSLTPEGVAAFRSNIPQASMLWKEREKARAASGGAHETSDVTALITALSTLKQKLIQLSSALSGVAKA